MATVLVVATRLMCDGSKWSHGQNFVLYAKTNLIGNGSAEISDWHQRSATNRGPVGHVSQMKSGVYCAFSLVALLPSMSRESEKSDYEVARAQCLQAVFRNAVTVEVES